MILLSIFTATMDPLSPNVLEGHVSRAREAGKEAGGAGVRACARAGFCFRARRKCQRVRPR